MRQGHLFVYPNNLGSLVEISFVHLSAVDSLEPSHSVLSKLLDLGLQLVVLHLKIIHSPYSWDQLSRVPGTDPIHQRSTNRAEVIGHGAARGNGLALRINGKLVLAADMRSSRLVDDEVGRERRRMDLVVVAAVTDERGDEVWAFDRLGAL